MKKNLIMIVSVCLVLVMTLSLVSAIKMTDGQKKYLKSGRTYDINFDDKGEFDVVVNSVNSNRVNVEVDGIAMDIEK